VTITRFNHLVSFRNQHSAWRCDDMRIIH
jgi:hypothetical protein